MDHKQRRSARAQHSSRRPTTSLPPDPVALAMASAKKYREQQQSDSAGMPQNQSPDADHTRRNLPCPRMRSAQPAHLPDHHAGLSSGPNRSHALPFSEVPTKPTTASQPPQASIESDDAFLAHIRAGQMATTTQRVLPTYHAGWLAPATATATESYNSRVYPGIISTRTISADVWPEPAPLPVDWRTKPPRTVEELEAFLSSVRASSSDIQAAVPSIIRPAPLEQHKMPGALDMRPTYFDDFFAPVWDRAPVVAETPSETLASMEPAPTTEAPGLGTAFQAPETLNTESDVNMFLDTEDRNIPWQPPDPFEVAFPSPLQIAYDFDALPSLPALSIHTAEAESHGLTSKAQVFTTGELQNNRDPFALLEDPDMANTDSVLASLRGHRPGPAHPALPPIPRSHPANLEEPETVHVVFHTHPGISSSPPGFVHLPSTETYVVQAFKTFGNAVVFALHLAGLAGLPEELRMRVSGADAEVKREEVRTWLRVRGLVVLTVIVWGSGKEAVRCGARDDTAGEAIKTIDPRMLALDSVL